MPITSKFHLEHIYDLALQMKRAPEEVRKKQIQSAENLLIDLEEETIYPLDYVVYRITRYRGDAIEQPMLAGNALIGDIVS